MIHKAYTSSYLRLDVIYHIRKKDMETRGSNDHTTTGPSTFTSLLWMKSPCFPVMHGSGAEKVFGCLFEQQDKNGFMLKMQD